MDSNRKTLAGNAAVMAYPARFERMGTAFSITFIDFPQVVARCGDGEDPLAVARHVLDVTVAEAIAGRLPIPAPSKVPGRLHGDSEERFGRLIPVDQTLAIKAILWDHMRDRGISNVALAKTLGCDEKEVRRMLDPTTQSRSRLAEALDVVGCPIAVTVVDTARQSRILKAPGQSGSYRPELETAVAVPGED